MTIKELEERTGLDRATIRFYEKEGLISPRRMANGYRDYTPAEASALEKIAFLRRLGLSMEQIRRVQTGELPLGVALVSGQKGVDLQKALRQLDDFFSEGSGQLTLGDWTVEQRVEDPDGCFSQFHYTGGMWIFLGEHVAQVPQAPTIHFSVTKTE